MYQETIISNSFITNIKISDGAYRLYILLQSMCYGDKDSCYPSQKYMSCALGRSVRNIQRYLKEFVKNKLISIKRRGSVSSIITVLERKTKQVGKKVVSTIKNAAAGFKTQNKDNKNNKQSNWKINHRNYDFHKLEKALTGQINYRYEELLE